MIQGAIRSRQWLEVLDELNIGAFTVDTDHQITAINYSAQALMGLRGHEVTGLDCREVFTGVPCMGACQIAVQDGATTDEPDVVVTDETDSDHLITHMATPLFDADGRVMGCLTILQDHSPITELVDRVHYEARRQKIILDSLDLAVFTVNRGGLITFFNTAAERISGFHRSRLLGRPAEQLFGGAERPEMELLHETMASGRSHRQHRGRLLDKDGVGVPIRANFMVLRNEKEAVICRLTCRMAHPSEAVARCLRTGGGAGISAKHTLTPITAAPIQPATPRSSGSAASCNAARGIAPLRHWP